MLAIVFGGALEELCPRVNDVGCPVLLAVTVFLAWRESALFGLTVALAAGALEEALSGAPPATAISFFVLGAFAVRKLELPMAGAVFAYPAYVSWMALMCLGQERGAFGRLFVSVPLGLVTMAATCACLQFVRRKAGLDAR